MVIDFMYVLYFLLGGSLVTLIYHFSKEKNTIACSILPAFPTFFALGYILLYYFGGNIKNYVNNSIKTFGIDVICMMILLGLLTYLNTLVAFILFFIIYLFIIYQSVVYNILV